MKRVPVRMIVGIVLLACLLAPATALAKGGGPNSSLVANLNATLEPGVLHGWVIAPSSACGGYLVEATPRGHYADGGYVEMALVRPEFDGVDWNDVLRVQIPEGQPPLKANLRVYSTCGLPEVFRAETILTAGDWIGWVIGPASMDRGLVVEVTPLDPSVEGAYVEKALIQDEYCYGDWHDVLRVQLAAGLPAQKVELRVYATDGLPVLGEYELELEPGVWVGTALAPSTAHGWYIVEINPRDVPIEGEFVERLRVQPEFNGKHWNDVLRMMTPIDQPPLTVQARVYRWATLPPQRP